MKSTVPEKFLKIFLYLASVQSFVTAFLTFAEKSEGGGVIFGLSFFRFALLMVLLIAATVFLFTGFHWGTEKKTVLRVHHFLERNWHSILFVTSWGFFFLALLQHSAYFSTIFSGLKSVDVPNLFLRLRPMLILGSLIFFEFSVALYLTSRNQLNGKTKEKVVLFVWILGTVDSLITGSKEKNGRGDGKRWFELKPGLQIWLVVLAIWLFIAWSKVGLIPDDRFWNVAGVPFLPQQIVFTLLLLLFMLDFNLVMSFRGTSKLAELSKSRAFFFVLMIVIWATAVLVWNGEPLRHTYFAPGPYPPNYEKYPFSDAATFDIGSQYFLLGRGLNNQLVTDRPFLMLFFSVLHLLGGQKYDSVVFVQILFLALIPVLLFWLGSKLHSKPVGISLALLAVLKEKNAIQGAAEIGLANVKVLTSELFATLLVLFLTLAVAAWLEKKNEQTVWPVLAGGVLGLSVGVKVTTLFLLPVILVVVLFAHLQQKIWLKKFILSGSLFVLAMMVVITPYSIESAQNAGVPFWLAKIINSFDRSYGQEDADGGLIQNKNEKPINPIRNVMRETGTLDLPENIFTLSLRHFIHNEISTLLMYPLSYEVQSLDQLLARPFWDHDLNWKGELKWSEKILLGMNLLFISIGIGYAFRRSSYYGLVPLAIHLGFNLTSGGARTSGGRYIVPVDWVVHLYFLLGVVSLIYAVRNWRQVIHPESTQHQLAKTKPIVIAVALIGFLGLGSSIMLTKLFQPEYPMSRGALTLEILQRLPESVYDEFGISFEEIKAFSQEKKNYVGGGFSLYPRYFEPGEFDKWSTILSVKLNDVERLYFTLLTEQGPKHVYLEKIGQWVEAFPNAEFVIVIGCNRGDYIEGKIVLPLEGNDPDPVLSSSPGLLCE